VRDRPLPLGRLCRGRPTPRRRRLCQQSVLRRSDRRQARLQGAQGPRPGLHQGFAVRLRHLPRVVYLQV